MKFITLISLFVFTLTSWTSARSIHVFVCLADNTTQGLVPVPPKIGNGDDAAVNLYWGCSEALPPLLKQSKTWKLVKREADPSPQIIERLRYQHTSMDATLLAEAYRGSKMRECLADFEGAIRGGAADLLVFVGHNGLMDFSLPVVHATPEKRSDVAVLCCKSDKWFGQRINDQGGRAVLLTSQFMYPGGFLVRDLGSAWLAGGDRAALRAAAAKAYATNQGISVKSARGVFAVLE